ncbi:AAA family ATPase [Shewanella putrefaciens]
MSNILDSFKKTKASIKAVLNQWGYEVNSSGTKDLSLPSNTSLDNSTGYWDLAANRGVLNKPPRWIVHIRNQSGNLVTDLAKDISGQALSSAGSIGYINNRAGKSVVAMCRLMPAFMDGSSNFSFPDGWEWIVVFAFESPLPAGTSGELLSNFNANNSTLDYKGDSNQQSQPFTLSVIGLIKSKSNQIQTGVQLSGHTFTYDDVTNSIEAFLRRGTASVFVCDPDVDTDLTSLAREIESNIRNAITVSSSTVKQITPASNLVGISPRIYSLINASLRTGKKHFIFYGPPGTGKTTLAEHIAEQLSEDDSFIQLTASSSWSSQDLVGGYQPIGNGNIAFIPGVMLKNFDSPIIIDEMNRCPIDKVIGPLFSVLSGQATTLPYRVDISNPNSESYKILPSPVPTKAQNEFAPGQSWSMICTLNQVDKTQLGQLSYALSRRFAWIRIGIPDNVPHFIVDIIERLGFLNGAKNYNSVNPIASMWLAVNKVRELGGAPFIDMIKLIKELDSSLDLLGDSAGDLNFQELLIHSFAVCISPLLDGIRASEAEELSETLARVWSLSDDLKGTLDSYLSELAI